MKRAFTLVELVVVLLVLTLVTHLAVRELSSYRDRKLSLAADRQLESLRNAVSDGFLADMGRLPRVTDEPKAASDSVSHATLSELWRCPEDASPYAVLPAVASNLVENLRTTLTNADIFVATGWRGPYVRLPMGKSRLLDPWGNPIEETDDAGLPRLVLTNGEVVAASHYGPHAQSRDRRTLSLLPDGGARSRLVVRCVSTGGAAIDRTVEYRWYGPASGLITGAVAKAVFPAAVTFDGLTPGVRIVWDSETRTPRQTNVLPGDNYVEIRIP